MENKIDFYVYGYQKLFEVGGKSVYLTTTHVCLAIVFAILVIFAIVMNRKIAKADPTKPPKGILNVMEMLVEMLDNRTFSNHGLKRNTVWMDRVKPLMVDLKDMVVDRLGEVPR